MISFEKFILTQSQFEYYNKLMICVDNMYENHIIYPPKSKLFRLFELCNLDDIKVVIIGQDPYINEGQADGIAFSVDNGKITPTLTNIYKELYNDLKIIRNITTLDDWVEQGVFLINVIMTVNKGESLSHKNIGWEVFFENLLNYIDDNKSDILYVFWGNFAKKYKKSVKNGIVIESSHPSPLGAYRGFFGSKPFSTINNYLKTQDKAGIKW